MPGTRFTVDPVLQESIASLRTELELSSDVARQSRLRIRLADRLVAGGDPSGAAAELQEAGRASPTREGVEIAARAIGACAGVPDRLAFLRACGFDAAPAERAAEARPSSGSVRLDSASLAAGSAALDPATSSAPSSASESVVAPVWPAPAAVRAANEPERRPPAGPLEVAFEAWAERKPLRARRLAEELARRGGLEPDAVKRLHALVDDLASAGFIRDALLLARTLCEEEATDEGRVSPPDVPSILGLIDRAAMAGADDLAKAWAADLGGLAGPELDGGGSGPSATAGSAGAWMRFRTAERDIYRLHRPGGARSPSEPPTPPLVPPPELELAGTRMPGFAALALAETAFAGPAERELWRLGFETEVDSSRRALLAARWIAAEIAADDASDEALLGALNLAISSIPAASSQRLRRLRVERLRGAGQLAELAVALGEDAAVASGEERTQRLADQADVWAELGENSLALEVRLQALSGSPGCLRALAPARRQLEAEGRRAESLALVVQAVPLVKSASDRLSLLRQLAALAEAVPGGRRRAASAWLDVLKMAPDDAAARAGALRTLAETGDHERMAELLAWTCAQEQPSNPESLWRLAEFRRVVLHDPTGALPLYRLIVTLRGPDPRPDRLSFADDGWQRTDDQLALHSARALAAPSAAQRAMALVDRATILMVGGQLEAAEADLSRAMDLDMAGGKAMLALERLYELRNDFRGFRQRLQARLGVATGGVAAQLWFGIGRANERLGDPAAALSSYASSVLADARFAPALAALRKSAAARGDHSRAAQLLVKEVELAEANADLSAPEKAELLVELGLLRLEKLNDPAGALAALEAAVALDSGEPRAQQALFEASLAMGSWERAAELLEAMLGAGIGVSDAARSYYRVGRVAETAGRVESGLTFYSRSYARMTSYRPTLERLSELCFDRQQWDNAWKATEHLLERHGTDLDLDTRATLAARAGLADLHVAQRFAATHRISALFPDVGPSAGVRDVADSWASMRIEPRLLLGIEHERRGRILSRLGEVISLTQANPAHPARQTAREVLAAMAMVDRRWADALALLEALAGDENNEARRRADFFIAAGDIHAAAYQDLVSAAERYRRAAGLAPAHGGLARVGVRELLGGDPGHGA